MERLIKLLSSAIVSSPGGEEAWLPDKTIIGTAHTVPLTVITISPSSSPVDHSEKPKFHHDSSLRTRETTTPNQTPSRQCRNIA
ncbi:hypothetical protein Bca4012_025339 [Brassica carinata]